MSTERLLIEAILVTWLVLALLAQRGKRGD